MTKAGEWGGVWIRWVQRAALAGAVAMFGLAGSSRADLTNLFTFNDGTANDSIGNGDGTILGSAFVDGDGVLQLPGGGSDYVSLNGPGINITSFTDATFEAWFTVNSNTAWQRVFDLGDRTAPATDDGYVYYTPFGTSAPSFRYGTGGSVSIVNLSTLQTERRYHLAVVIDDNANGGSEQIQVYVDGIAQLSPGAPNTRSFSSVPNTFAYLGRSLVADPNLNGSIDEFRIYDHALSGADVISSFNEGPAPVDRFRIEVNTVTGSVVMLGRTNSALSFDYYTLTSNSGHLNPDGWNSLDDQNLDAIDDEAGHSWDEAPADTAELTELFMRGASIVLPNERMELGHAYNPLIAGLGMEGNITFRYSVSRTSQLVLGDVDFVTPDAMAGDYNGDDAVNAADYVVWRNTVGTGDLRADGDENGRIDRDDYLVWKYTYGNTTGDGASLNQANVPEPAGILLAVLATLAGFAVRRERK